MGIPITQGDYHGKQDKIPTCRSIWCRVDAHALRRRPYYQETQQIINYP
jgi:hypothetical protein